MAGPTRRGVLIGVAAAAVMPRVGLAASRVVGAERLVLVPIAPGADPAGWWRNLRARPGVLGVTLLKGDDGHHARVQHLSGSGAGYRRLEF